MLQFPFPRVLDVKIRKLKISQMALSSIVTCDVDRATPVL